MPDYYDSKINPDIEFLAQTDVHASTYRVRQAPMHETMPLFKNTNLKHGAKDRMQGEDLRTNIVMYEPHKAAGNFRSYWDKPSNKFKAVRKAKNKAAKKARKRK